MRCGGGDASIPTLGLLPSPLQPFLHPCSPVFPPACPSFYLGASFRQPSPRGRLEYQDVREMYRKRSNKNKALAGGAARFQQHVSRRLLPSLLLLVAPRLCYWKLSEFSPLLSPLEECSREGFSCRGVMSVLASPRPGYEVRSPRKQTTLATFVLRPLPTCIPLPGARSSTAMCINLKDLTAFLPVTPAPG